jgi:peptidoglycan/xylan/chitin deacetylase (PgdA/CDA1 family)
MTLRRLLRGVRVRVGPPKAKPLILMYHRVAVEALDPWGNIVSPSNFEEHLDVLRRTRFPLSLTDFVSRHLHGMLPADAVAVTFDDGYVDNLFAAKPRLLAADIPATVFLATGYLGRPGEFWWDELARLVLTGTGPAALEVTVRGKAMRLDLANDGASRGDHWKAWLEPPRTARQAAYLEVWRIFRSLESREREALMGEIKRAFTSPPAQREVGRPMTTEEVRVLVDDQLIAIGPHTVTHASLPDLDPRSRTREIIASKEACEALAGAEAKAFAYPFGDLDAGVRATVDGAGFVCACSTKHGPVLHSSDVFALPRIHVVDCDGDRFERSLRYASMAVDEGPG